MIWSEPKDVDVADRYGFTMDTEWLDGESITSVVFTPSVESGVVVESVSLLEAPTVSAVFSGGNEGFWPVHVRVSTATRQREYCFTLWVKQGCL
jgi:hypothetical protein